MCSRRVCDPEWSRGSEVLRRRLPRRHPPVDCRREDRCNREPGPLLPTAYHAMEMAYKYLMGQEGDIRRRTSAASIITQANAADVPPAWGCPNLIFHAGPFRSCVDQNLLTNHLARLHFARHCLIARVGCLAASPSGCLKPSPQKGKGRHRAPPSRNPSVARQIRRAGLQLTAVRLDDVRDGHGSSPSKNVMGGGGGACSGRPPKVCAGSSHWHMQA